MSKSIEIEFLINGNKVGSSSLIVSGGQMSTEMAEEAFYAVLRKNEKSLIAQAEDEMREEIIDSLTKEQEDVLQEKHAEDYHGTDDDMPDAYEDWLMELTLEDLKHILKI